MNSHSSIFFIGLSLLIILFSSFSTLAQNSEEDNLQVENIITFNILKATITKGGENAEHTYRDLIKKVKRSSNKIRKANVPDSIKANLLHDLGSKFYYKLWKEIREDSVMEEGIKVSEEALFFKEKVGLTNCSINKTLYNLGFFNFRINNLKSSIQFYNKLVNKGFEFCKDCTHKCAKKNKVPKAIRELAKIYNELGDYQKSESLGKQILVLGKDEKSKDYFDIIDEINAHYIIANAQFYLGINEYAESILENLQRSNSLLLLNRENLPSGYFRNKYNSVEVLLANTNLELNNFQRAIDLYQSVLINLKTESNKKLETQIVLANLGHAYFKISNLNKAEQTLENSLKIDPTFSLPYESMADIYKERNQRAKAMEYYQLAIDIYENPEPELFKQEIGNRQNTRNLKFASSISLNNNTTFLIDHLLAKANAFVHYQSHYENEGLEKAKQLYFRADSLIDVIRFQSTFNQSSFFWRKQAAQLYGNALEVCFLLKDTQSAFYFMERNKAVLLGEELSKEQMMNLSNIPLDLQNQEYILKNEVNYYSSVLDSSPSNESILKLAKAKQAYEEFNNNLKINYPKYASIKNEFKVVSLDEIKKDSIQYIHFLFREKSAYILSTFLGVQNLKKVAIDSSLISHITEYRRFMVDKVGENLKYANQISCEIQNTFFSQFDQKAVSICLILDGPLLSFPIGGIWDCKDQKYLIEKFSFYYVNSISHQKYNTNKNRNTSDVFLGLAPQNFKSLNLKTLPFSRNEIQYCVTLFQTSLLTNREATKAKFDSLSPSFQLIHLATHAGVKKENGVSKPWLAFSDELMEMDALYRLKLNASLTVLSGCETSLGEEQAGEGVMSLGRAFMASGSKSVLSSLWKVDDRRTSELMQYFYQSLNNGYSTASALTNAKRQYLKNNKGVASLPAYWASFIYIGENEVLDLAEGKHFIFSKTQIILTLSSLILLITFFFWQKKK